MLSKRQLWYFPCLALSALFLFLKGGIYAKILDIADFGELNKLFLVISVLITFGAVGMQLLGHKMLPMYYAKNDRRQVVNLLMSALLIYLFVSAVLGMAASVVCIFWHFSTPAEIWVVLAAGAGQFSFLLILIDIKSRLNFIGNAVVTLLRSMVLLCIGAAAAWLFRNILWVLLAETFVNVFLFSAVFAKSRSIQMLRHYLDLRELGSWVQSHMRGAIKLVVLDLSTLALFSIDKWSGFIVLDNHQYGIYALGLIVLTTFEMLQRMVNVAAYPTMSYMIGKGDYHAAYKVALIALALAAIAAALLYYPAILTVNYLIDHFLIKYVQAKLVIDILIVAGILRVADFFTSYCILSNRELRLSRFQVLWAVLGVAVVAVLYFARLVRFGPVLLALIALGTSLFSIVTSIVLSVWINATRNRAVMRPVTKAG